MKLNSRVRQELATERQVFENKLAYATTMLEWATKRGDEQTMAEALLEIDAQEANIKRHDEYMAR